MPAGVFCCLRKVIAWHSLMVAVTDQTFFPKPVGAGITATLNMWRFTNSMASYYQIAENDKDFEDAEWTRIRMLNEVLKTVEGLEPDGIEFKFQTGYFVNGRFKVADDPNSAYVLVEAIPVD
ncbi:hypothetical protein L3Y21_gp129 [Gordonia phage Rabbitrun]|uniref:Uncharacterized protein n=1 Tax=Gordonia phage Rabbitrun TaxID=2762280 RepID=A0A7G8LIR8_9CAUD|nr:hypothetical protein L3Y21_gp129 [Gordonia phage Rabbitrun]QNJ57140.1 hypothetical protein SEA_RABBITRUN_107 [Gordonia phage Rabbitrun]